MRNLIYQNPIKISQKKVEYNISGGKKMKKVNGYRFGQVEVDKYAPTSNVIQLNPHEYPKDLLTIPEVKEKYGLGYSFVYKWVMLKKELTAYDKAGIAVSEKELLEFLKNRSKKWQQPRKCGE